MGQVLKFFLTIYVITLIISMIIAVVKFWIDTRKWHDKEETAYIKPSQLTAPSVEVVEAPPKEKPAESVKSTESPIAKESEVNIIDTDDRKRHTSAIF